ncbi:hypothetical protein [Muricoccus aerilatus]|uniref:hypothetical protein n=1 Tax=Muricoccus aerilatus TaxID=452982 RepID=UPI0005C1A340|nr:hypothetical protein [Roseomonas aerilata]
MAAASGGIQPNALCEALEDVGTSLPMSGPPAFPPLLTARNIGPSVTPAVSSQRRRWVTVRVDSQRTSPLPSWSVLLGAMDAGALPEAADAFRRARSVSG